MAVIKIVITCETWETIETGKKDSEMGRYDARNGETESGCGNRKNDNKPIRRPKEKSTWRIYAHTGRACFLLRPMRGMKAEIKKSIFRECAFTHLKFFISNNATTGEPKKAGR